MQSTSSLKKYPIKLGIFTKTLTDNIFEDMRFVQLMNLLVQSDSVYKYSYCFYCDNSLIKTNIFIPVFHSVYMACQTNNIIINNSDDIWLTNIFKHNKYYVLSSKTDDFDYKSYGVNVIDNIKDIDGVI